MESVKSEFKNRMQKRIICAVIFMIFVLPAIAIQLYFEPSYLLGIRANIVTLALQSVGFICALLAVKYSKCPACNQYTGNGWSVIKCSKCGIKLT
jgi:hypothetical protein